MASGLAGCLIEWEPAWICQQLEPGGRTPIDESVGMHQNLNPRIDPLARIIALARPGHEVQRVEHRDVLISRRRGDPASNVNRAIRQRGTPRPPL